MEKCVFCNREKIRQDILGETKNFFVKVGFGLISPGHVMLIPKEHCLCYGDLPDRLEKEYKELKELLQKQIADKFATPFLIEYGVWGQTVHHAHVHFIPLKGPNYEINSIMEEMVIPGGVDFEQADRRKLKEIYKAEKRYVGIEERGKLYVCHVSGLPDDKTNPHLRFRVFFTQKGLKGVLSWEEMSEEDKIRDEKKRYLTKRKLTNVL